MSCEKIESVTSHNFYPPPSPCHKLPHFLRPPPPWSVTYFMDSPHGSLTVTYCHLQGCQLSQFDLDNPNFWPSVPTKYLPLLGPYDFLVLSHYLLQIYNSNLIINLWFFLIPPYISNL